MATLHIEPKECELLEQTKLAAANKEQLAMDPHQISLLAYGYFRYREIVAELKLLKWGRHEHVVQDVSQLIGEHLALQAFAQGSGSVPLKMWEACDQALTQWENWARLLLADREPVVSMGRTVLQDTIGVMCGSLEGAARRLENEVTVLTDENKEVHAKLRQWEQWAEGVAPKCSSAQEQRESIRARLKSG